MRVAIPASHRNTTVSLTADVVAAYLRHHVVPLGGLSGLISEVHFALTKTSVSAQLAGPTLAIVEKQKPAVSIRKSVQDEQITCLECGGLFKSLKRHLLAFHALSPADYRHKWRLPTEYPMVAPAYAEARSILAKEMGLGLDRGRARRSGQAATADLTQGSRILQDGSMSPVSGS
jgi:predicted transcriptional regulator